MPTELAAGTHTVSESSVPTYTAAFSGDCDSEGVVNLAYWPAGALHDYQHLHHPDLDREQGRGGRAALCRRLRPLCQRRHCDQWCAHPELAAGTYTVTRAAYPPTPPLSPVTVTASGVVNLAIGQQALCVDHQHLVPSAPQTLTVSKVVADGPLSADDFELFVNGNPVTNGVALELPPGAYTVSESSVPTYTASFSGDCDASGLVNLAIGEQALCVLTNTFIPSRTGTVSGTVVDKGGSAIEGALVTLSNEAGVVSAALVRTESTDADGRLSL